MQLKVLSFATLLNHFHLAVKLYLPIFWKDQISRFANLVKFCPLKSVRFYSSICFIRFSMNAGFVTCCPRPPEGVSWTRIALALLRFELHCNSKLLVGLDGLEPSTSRVSGARSNHLSYRPLFLLGGHQFSSSWWR